MAWRVSLDCFSRRRSNLLNCTVFPELCSFDELTCHFLETRLFLRRWKATTHQKRHTRLN